MRLRIQAVPPALSRQRGPAHPSFICRALKAAHQIVCGLLQGGEDEDEGSSPQDLWAPSVLSRITDIACSL